MNALTKSALAMGLALSIGAPVSAADCSTSDPVLASFCRDLNRGEPTPAQWSRHAELEPDRLPGMVRGLVAGYDEIVASFHRDLHREPTPEMTVRVPVEQDQLPEQVRAALGGSVRTKPGYSSLARSRQLHTNSRRGEHAD